MKLNWKTNKYCTVDVCQKHLEGGGLRRVEDFKYSLYTSIPHSNELEHSQEHFFFFFGWQHILFGLYTLHRLSSDCFSYQFTCHLTI